MSTTRVRTVRLYGKLGQMFGREFTLAVASPAEAVRALAAQIPGFEEHFMNAHKRGVGFAVFTGKKNITKDELTHPCGDDTIKIAPVLMGSKEGGWLNIVLGVVLIVVGVWMMGADGGFLTKSGMQMLAGGLIYSGVAMAIGGVIQLLSPGPKGIGGEDAADSRANHNFNGPVNTTAQGNPVPVLYGRMKVGSAVVSAGIIAQDDDVYVPGGSSNSSGGGSVPWHDFWRQVDEMQPE